MLPACATVPLMERRDYSKASGKNGFTRRMDASSVRVAAGSDGRTRRPSYDWVCQYMPLA